MSTLYREMFRFYRRKCHGYGEDDSVLQSSEGCLGKIDIVGLSRFGRRGRMAGSPELGEISGSLKFFSKLCLSKHSEFIYYKLGEIFRL